MANKETAAKPYEYTPQNFGDGKIEIITFDSISKMTLEHFVSGQANIIAQGNEFDFEFKEKNSKGNVMSTYFQVDGEYYKAYGLK